MYNLSYFNHTPAGRITAVKGIRIEYEPNGDAVKLLKRYTAMVQELLDIAYEKSITSIGKLNEHRRKVVQKHRLAGMNSVLTMKGALAIYKDCLLKHSHACNQQR